MLLDVDARKAATMLCASIEKSSGGTPIRAQLEKFAAENGLQI